MPSTADLSHMYSVVFLGFAGADKARADAAAHSLLERNLTLNLALADLCDSLEHRRGTAGADGVNLAEVFFENVGDKALNSRGAVVGREVGFGSD